MHRLLLPLALVTLVAACAPGPTVRLHDLYVFGTLDARLSHFYGDETELRYGDGTLNLTRGEPATRGARDPYVVAEALSVNGQPYLSQSVEPLGQAAVTASRIPLTTDMQLHVRVPTEQIVYFDGNSFLLLAEEGVAGNQVRVVPRPLVNRLRGLGQLNSAEAAMLESAVRSAGRPAVLAFLPTAELPPHSVDGLEDHRRTAIYVQQDVGTDSGAFRPSPTELTWEVMAQGNQATGFGSATYELVTNESQLLSLWNRAHGALLSPPQVPRVDFARETVVAIFIGGRGTGGHSVSVQQVTEENGELYLDVSIGSPAPGTITTQALTSPWVLVRVLRGGYDVAWLRDPATGNLIGAARAAF
ncbi:MAG: protease complex subunit PrcB family protein [Trueperaceae bacterium]